MTPLAPEDQPDMIDIGPVQDIPVQDDDDPRPEDDRAAWRSATARAQALCTAEELLSGIAHVDWRVRHETVDRLAARWPDDPRTVHALIDRLHNDEAWEVRDAVALAMTRFPREDVIAALRTAQTDERDEVRWSANHALRQLGC